MFINEEIEYIKKELNKIRLSINFLQEFFERMDRRLGWVEFYLNSLKILQDTKIEEETEN